MFSMLYFNHAIVQSVKQQYNQLASSAIENVTKLSFASERMQAAERAHNFVDFCLQRTSTVSEVSRLTVTISAVQSPTLEVTQMRCRAVAVHRR